jgi:hypothetical protein
MTSSSGSWNPMRVRNLATQRRSHPRIQATCWFSNSVTLLEELKGLLTVRCFTRWQAKASALATRVRYNPSKYEDENQTAHDRHCCSYFRGCRACRFGTAGFPTKACRDAERFASYCAHARPLCRHEMLHYQASGDPCAQQSRRGQFLQKRSIVHEKLSPRCPGPQNGLPQGCQCLTAQLGRPLNHPRIMNDSDFDDLLRSAGGNSPLPRLFREGVWRRIENDGVQLVHPWYFGFFNALAKPWGTAAGLAATVALGLWLGAVTGPREQRTAASYAYSISPFAQADHR